MDWGSQRKSLYLGTIFGIFFIILATFIYFKFLNKAPTCFDGVLNQDEQGVDCGGSCALLCKEESRPLNTVYSRLFKIGYGSYSVLALVENQNQNVFARQVQYIFKVYDVDNILLTEVSGVTYAPPGRIFPIFEHSILTGNREASKISFQINNDAVSWEKGEYVDPKVRITNINTELLDTRSRISAFMVNDEVYPIKDIQVIAVVYDNQGNARESSSTAVDYVSPNDQIPLVFTWNNKFDFEVSKIDITPKVTPREWIQR